MATQLGQAVVEEIRRRSTVAFSEIAVRSAARPRASRGGRAGGHDGPAAPRRRASCTSPPTSRRARRSRSPTRRDSGSSRASARPHGQLPRGDQEGPRPRARPARVLAPAPAPPRPAHGRPDAQLPRAAASRAARVRDGRRSVRRAVRPDLRAPGGAAARRVRLAGRPELPGHARPARPDDERVRRDLARLPGEPVARADPSRDGVRAAARRPRLRRPGRERNDDRRLPVGRRAMGLADERPGVLPLSRRGGRVLGARPAACTRATRRARTDPDKTLLGARQRRWLFDSLARSRARFKLICSPCTIFLGGNSRDGNWSNDFEAERDAAAGAHRQPRRRDDDLPDGRHAPDGRVRLRRPVRGARGAGRASRSRTTSR